MRYWYLALFVAIAAPTAAQPSVDAQASANMARGDLLYAYDQSAWHVTDAALKAIPKATMNLLRGYIVTPADGGYRTTFYGGEPGSHFRLYTAIWSNRAVVQPELLSPERRVPVTADEERLIAAKAIALSNLDQLQKCSSGKLNSAVIPGRTTQDPVSIYILTPSTRPNAIPMGGHYRIDVKYGAVVSQRKFTNSCIELERTLPTGKQGRPVALMISHLLDPVPTEIHAFAVHAAGLPMYVATPDGTLYSVQLDKGRAVARKTKQRVR